MEHYTNPPNSPVDPKELSRSRSINDNDGFLSTTDLDGGGYEKEELYAVPNDMPGRVFDYRSPLSAINSEQTATKIADTKHHVHGPQRASVEEDEAGGDAGHDCCSFCTCRAFALPEVRQTVEKDGEGKEVGGSEAVYTQVHGVGKNKGNSTINSKGDGKGQEGGEGEVKGGTEEIEEDEKEAVALTTA